MSQTIDITDAEEQAFVAHLESHIQKEWSNERRSAYIQHMVTRWRLHREHAHEKLNEYENHRAFIRANFKSSSLELYNFSQWPVNENLLHMLNSKTIDEAIIKTINGTGVYSFPILPKQFCQLFVNEITYIEQWGTDHQLKLTRPNSMNKYGVILDHFGFDKCLNDVMKNVAEPLTRLLFPHITLPLDSHHGFIVEYDMNKDRKLDFHVDDSAVTLNICLGTEFTGGQLYFGGVRCPSHTSTTQPRDDEETFLEHEVGTACFHLGNHRHRALPITSGRRLNLILWCRSSSFSDEIKNIHKNHCPTWCGHHQTTNTENI